VRLQSKEYQVALLSAATEVLNDVYGDPPDLMIVDLSPGNDGSAEMIASLRADSFFSTIPVIGLLEPGAADRLQWERCPLDDFLLLPMDFNELFCRISLALFRIKRIFDNNPLTRLPGNTSIQRAIEESIGKPLAVCYLDINSFKPYNDVYGFARGDEVIRMLARIMFNAVRESGGGFCGHIGGDDFVAIVPAERAEGVCQTIVAYFDRIVLDLFDEETKRRGYYSGVNRRGMVEQIPLLSISIGVVSTDSPSLRHAGKVAEVAAELKARAKESKKSCYIMDRRGA
jgi:diguanylate cyclase (GGDEF)-like protein